MDPLSALLDAGDRITELRLSDPWTVTLAATAHVTLLVVSTGEVWCHRADGEPLHLESGDLALLRPDVAHVLSESPTPPARWPVTARGTTVAGESLAGGTRLFVRPFPRGGAACPEFLDVLASEQVLPTARDSGLWTQLRDEADHLSVATTSVVTRLVDLLFIDAVRRLVAEGEAQGWMRAVFDPVVGAALHLFHDRPAHPWTLQEVAQHVGTSRASLARRFVLLVGEPPMTYLRQWRLTRAAGLLEQEPLSVAEVARRCGFSDPFDFSAAFSRKFGVGPRHYRGRHSSAGSA